MQIVSAFQLMKGKVVDKSHTWTSAMSSLMQPRQMLPYTEKTDEWRAWNMDWFEMEGMKQIRTKVKRLSQNYRIANSVIDIKDYIPDEENENSDLIRILDRESDPTTNSTALTELKFFPIAPHVVDLLVGEHLKRNNKVYPYAVDSLSKNEKLDKKKQMVDQVLISQAQQELMVNLSEMGVDMESPEAQEQLSPDAIKSLPDVERYMKKSYRGAVEQWAGHQINADRFRFRMDELQSTSFRDSIITDMAVWEVDMMEDDYLPRVIDNRFAFYHKSLSTRYLSQGDFAGYIDLQTMSEVIDNFGYLMDEEEIKSMESSLPGGSPNLLLSQKSEDYYDPTKSYEENQRGGSLDYRRMQAFEEAFGSNRGSFETLLQDDNNSELNRFLFRVTKTYWKSKKRVGHLTKIDENGIPSNRIVTEDYIITDKPLYDNTFYVEDSALNLVYGEHIDWIWINETWGGVKISPNTTSVGLTATGASSGMQPIYLGICGKRKPDRMPFQLKGENSLYGCRLPMEGIRFSERGAPSRSLVDRINPNQIAYNLINNKILDIVIDELGVVIILDQNTLPQHSMGEDWGKNNLARSYVAMKDFKILPLDTSLTNTETGVNFQHLQKIDASETQRLMGLIQLANYFWQQALSSVGITPERMGAVNSQQSATGTTVSVNNSYAQTEKYFTQHDDHLMPRVWEIMINCAQYYHSKGTRSSQLSYINDKDEEILYQMPEGLDLLPRDINVQCTTSYQRRELKDKLERLALENNTSGATIYDLGRILASDTPSEIMDTLLTTEQRSDAQRQQEYTAQQELEQLMLQSQTEEAEKARQFEASENEKDRRAQILEAEIKAGSYAGGQDFDADGQNDYLDTLQYIQGQQEYSDTMNFKRQQESNKQAIDRRKLDQKDREMASRERIAGKQLEVARENKTKAELEKRKKQREQKAKKK